MSVNSNPPVRAQNIETFQRDHREALKATLDEQAKQAAAAGDVAAVAKLERERQALDAGDRITIEGTKQFADAFDLDANELLGALGDETNADGELSGIDFDSRLAAYYAVPAEGPSGGEPGEPKDGAVGDQIKEKIAFVRDHWTAIAAQRTAGAELGEKLARLAESKGGGEAGLKAVDAVAKLMETSPDLDAKALGQLADLVASTGSFGDTLLLAMNKSPAVASALKGALPQVSQAFDDNVAKLVGQGVERSRALEIVGQATGKALGRAIPAVADVAVAGWDIKEFWLKAKDPVASDETKNWLKTALGIDAAGLASDFFPPLKAVTLPAALASIGVGVAAEMSYENDKRFHEETGYNRSSVQGVTATTMLGDDFGRDGGRALDDYKRFIEGHGAGDQFATDANNVLSMIIWLNGDRSGHPRLDSHTPDWWQAQLKDYASGQGAFKAYAGSHGYQKEGGLPAVQPLMDYLAQHPELMAAR